MINENFELHRSALNAYFDNLNIRNLQPSDEYLPYEFDFIDCHQWLGLGKAMVKDELQELTNILNHWQGLLLQWQAWNSVIKDYNEGDAWLLRSEFLESIAHHCLLQPSAMRDTFTFVATNSMHQVRLACEDDYIDFLEGDPTKPKEIPKRLNRTQKEKRLTKLISVWDESINFMTSLRAINDKAYQEKTSNYRNLVNHSIGPRLGIGDTRRVVRSVEQATEMAKQPDGKYKPELIPDKMAASYTFGGTEPLDMEKARVVNLEQYSRARVCYENYIKLLTIGLELKD